MKKLVIILNIFLGFKTFSHEPIFATIPGGDLYSFDLKNCTRNFIGSTGQGFGDIAFTPDGRLWGIVGGQLYQIDTSNANVSLIGNTGIGAVSLVGLNDSTLLAVYLMKLYAINNVTATSTYIDTIGYSASGDLTWYDDALYIVTSGGRLIKMNLNNTNTALISIDTMNSSSNPIPTCEGAVTASFEKNYNSIIGFNNADAYKICQIDGTYQLLCPALNVGGTPGAASIRLPSQIPQPQVCQMTNSIATINPFSSNFIIQQNPVTNFIKVTYSDKNLQPDCINLLDVSGKKIKNFIKLEGDLDVSEISSGVYLLLIISKNGEVYNQKIIIPKGE